MSASYDRSSTCQVPTRCNVTAVTGGVETQGVIFSEIPESNCQYLWIKIL